MFRVRQNSVCLNQVSVDTRLNEFFEKSLVEERIARFFANYLFEPSSCKYMIVRCRLVFN